MGDFTQKELLSKFKKLTDRFWLKNDLWYDVLKGIPYRKKVTLDLATMQAAGAVGQDQFELFELPAGAEIISIFGNVTTPLAGGVLAAATVSVADAAPWTQLLLAGNCFAGGLLTAIGTDLTADRGIYSMTAVQAVSADVILDAGGGETFDNLTAGEIDIHITYVQHND